jgi:hypothetical protein
MTLKKYTQKNNKKQLLLRLRKTKQNIIGDKGMKDNRPKLIHPTLAGLSLSSFCYAAAM